MAKKRSPRGAFFYLPSDQYPVMKWRNGRGETRQIAVDTEEKFRWRVSRAQLTESGPFSAFPGYDRRITFLGEGSVTLDLPEGIRRTIRPLECFAFPGEVEVTAEVSHPGEDLNLFTLREHAKGNLQIAYFREGEDLQFPLEGNENIVVHLSGQIEYLDPNSDSEGFLKAGSALRISRPSDFNLLNLRTRATGGPATCAWITIHVF